MSTWLPSGNYPATPRQVTRPPPQIEEAGKGGSVRQWADVLGDGGQNSPEDGLSLGLGSVPFLLLGGWGPQELCR